MISKLEQLKDDSIISPSAVLDTSRFLYSGHDPSSSSAPSVPIVVKPGTLEKTANPRKHHKSTSDEALVWSDSYDYSTRHSVSQTVVTPCNECALCGRDIEHGFPSAADIMSSSLSTITTVLRNATTKNDVLSKLSPPGRGGICYHCQKVWSKMSALFCQKLSGRNKCSGSSGLAKGRTSLFSFFS